MRVTWVAVSLLSLVVLFFFQAEDGIRDLTVTGVQTCALPISLSTLAFPLAGRRRARLARLERARIAGGLACRRRGALQGRAGRRSGHQGELRKFRARARVEDRQGWQQRHLLPRHTRVRSHLLERPGISAPR